MTGTDWSREEVDLVVSDYLEMLAAHFAGQQVHKSERRRQLQKRLNGRNDSSVERKRSNISAVVEKIGFHYLPGYKPLPNYQRILESVVLDRIQSAPWLDEAALAAVELPAVAGLLGDFTKVKTDAPRLVPRISEPVASFRAVRRDYIEREARNKSLGLAGEGFVVEYEKWRLRQLGEPKLADRVGVFTCTGCLSFVSNPKFLPLRVTQGHIAFWTPCLTGRASTKDLSLPSLGDTFGFGNMN